MHDDADFPHDLKVSKKNDRTLLPTASDKNFGPAVGSDPRLDPRLISVLKLTPKQFNFKNAKLG
jgi:hypothetical protein